MSDWPADQTPLFINSFSSYGPGPAGVGLSVSLTAATSFTWVANQAVYIPVILPWEYPVNRVFWANGSTVTSSNADFGIYSSSGALIYSTGSTALSGASNLQFVTPSTLFVLPAGLYYFAYSCNNTTNRSAGNTVATASNGAMMGLLSQGTAFPLPTTATFATYVTPGLELCGITRTVSGF